MTDRRDRYPKCEAVEPRRLLSGLGFADTLAVSPVDSANFIASADFNDDGKLDLVTSSFSSGGLTVLLGTGKGGFKAKGKVSLPAAPDFVTAADLNGDQKADVLAVSYTDNALFILRGNGDATFQAPTRLSAPGARAAVVGDFTGDLLPDLVLAKSYDSGISLLPSLAAGTFRSPLNQAFDFIPSDLVAGDFNNDGILDLAAVDFFKDKLHVLINGGGAYFQVTQTLTTGSGPTSVAAGDFNGDGKLDLATADFLGGSASVFLNSGNGSFGSGTRISTGQGATFAAAVNINGDSKRDLLIVNATADTISALISNGNGTFQPKVDLAAGMNPRSIATGDFNRDAQIDFVGANEGAAELSAVMSDKVAPQASFSPPLPLTTPGHTSHDFTVTYVDDLVFGTASLDDGDIRVTGPNGFSATASFVSSKQISITSRQATYRIAAPGGFWEPSDNGSYNVSVQSAAVRDTAGNPVAPGTLGAFEVILGDVGNTLADAEPLGSFSPGRTRVTDEFIGLQDRNDFHSFTVSRTSDVYIKLYNLADDADLQLLKENGSRLAYSKRGGSAVEFVTRTLSPGTYFARVLFSNGVTGTGYRLRLEASTPLPPPTANNTPETATDLGALSPGQVRAIEQTLGTYDRNDYYRFTLGAAGSVQLKLTDLTDDADLQLLDGAGAVLGYSKRTGAGNESITASVAKGTYFVRVLFKNGTRYTAYRLRIAVT